MSAEQKLETAVRATARAHGLLVAQLVKRKGSKTQLRAAQEHLKSAQQEVSQLLEGST